jgi:hypothetical protein
LIVFSNTMDRVTELEALAHAVQGILALHQLLPRY